MHIANGRFVESAVRCRRVVTLLRTAGRDQKHDAPLRVSAILQWLLLQYKDRYVQADGRCHAEV